MTAPLFDAMVAGDVAAVRRILKTDPDAPYAELVKPNHDRNASWRGPPVMMALAVAPEGQRFAIVRMLLDAGAQVEARTADGFTALHTIAGIGCEPLARLVLERARALGDEAAALLVDAVSDYGTTSLHVAAWAGRVGMVALLIGAGADPDRPVRGRNSWTGLHYAAAVGNVDVAAAMVAAGARLDRLDEAGETPIDVAVRHKQAAWLAAFASRAPQAARPRVQASLGVP